MNNEISLEHSSFYVHHGSWGSYSSLVLGKFGQGGGFAVRNPSAPSNNVYIGYSRPRTRPRLLPFFQDAGRDAEEERYTGGEADPSGKRVRVTVQTFYEDEIERSLGWATDSWRAGDMTFRLITPFWKIPELETCDEATKKFLTAPLVFGEITFDNERYDKPLTGVLAIQGMRRPLSDIDAGILGVASGTDCGFAIARRESVTETLSWDVCQCVFSGEPDCLNRLANEGGLCFHVPARSKESFPLVFGSYHDGVITSGKAMRFFYTDYFLNLEDALVYGIENGAQYLMQAEEKNGELARSSLNEHRKFLIAHGTHSYLANTELLVDDQRRPLFVVNEGEYRMMNTLDLVIDQLFWEMRFTPWTVKNILDSYAYSQFYVDEVKDSRGVLSSGGTAFCHDQGVADMFSPDGYSAYERQDRSGCFSYMTFEETLNWGISAGLYGILSGNLEWLSGQRPMLEGLFASLQNRDGNKDGMMDRDSARCGTGSEITTYDSLDASLGQARNNLYLAVKTWAAFVVLANVFHRLNAGDARDRAEACARSVALTITDHVNPRDGIIPALFEEKSDAKIIPAVEGLIYPFVIGDNDAVNPDGRFGALITALRKHLAGVLQPGICLDSVSGGWKLSSTSANTWMSKVFLNQFVAEKILGLQSDQWEEWDRIHAGWQQFGSGSFACTDQVESMTGRDLGSRFYPRLVTSILWLIYDKTEARKH